MIVNEWIGQRSGASEWDFFIGRPDVEIGGASCCASCARGGPCEADLGRRVEVTLLGLPPSRRPEAAAHVNNVWTYEALGYASPGSTEIVLAGLGATSPTARTTDPYPPESRPAFLRPYTHVKGTIRSAPTDLPSKMDTFVSHLRSNGWMVGTYSVGTDFEGPFGIPMSKDQPIDVLIHRTDKTYTASEAEAAVASALRSVNGVLIPGGTWLSSIRDVVVQSVAPDKEQFKVTADSYPTYDSWGPSNAWGCDEWIEWHRLMTSKYGAKYADDRFVAAWREGLSRFAGGKGTAPGSGLVFDAVPIDCRTTNDVFRAYLTSHPALYAVVFSGVTGTVMSAANAVQDVTKAVSETVSRNPKFSFAIAIGVVAAVGLGYAAVTLGPALRARKEVSS